MLELSAGMATALLVLHEMLRLAPGGSARRSARRAGLAALPILALFLVLLSLRVLAYFSPGIR